MIYNLINNLQLIATLKVYINSHTPVGIIKKPPPHQSQETRKEKSGTYFSQVVQYTLRPPSGRLFIFPYSAMHGGHEKKKVFYKTSSRASGKVAHKFPGKIARRLHYISPRNDRYNPIPRAQCIYTHTKVLQPHITTAAPRISAALFER